MRRQKKIKRFSTLFLVLPLLLFFAGCEKAQMIVNNVPEREANEIIVFLANKGIKAEKVKSAAVGPGGGTTAANLWNISVDSSQATVAMSILNQNGLPRVRGATLLQLFAAEGLMPSATEELIRYQAGLAEQIANMIRMIDGIIDAQVQLSIPPEEALPMVEKKAKKVTASVYVKHQGVLDDPNSHIITKIKRLVAGSVVGLDISNVTVIPDRARFADITLHEKPEALTKEGKEYVNIWSIVMSKESTSRFRLIFFILTSLTIFFLLILGWIIWKFYPLLRRHGGIKDLFRPIPLQEVPKEVSEEKEEEKEELPPEG